jgi:predicted DNA repair protein MutK
VDIKLLLDFVATFLWPLLMAYGAYLHREISTVQTKFDNLHEAHHRHVAQVNKDFATREVVSDLENKLTTVLNRIDDKVTRILEERK